MHSAIEKFLKEHGKTGKAKPVGTYVIRFGKHKGRSYDWIYENDPAYVAWVVTNKDETYTKRLKAYFMERIESDAESAGNE